MFSSRTAFFSAPSAPAPEPMILTIDTTLQANLVMLLPLRGNVNANIDWGDGTSNTVVNANQTTNISKTYAANGNYTITISGTVAGYGNADGAGTNLKITNITTFGNIGLTSIEGALRGANNLIGITNQIPGTITNLNSVFRASNLNANISNITNWNTSNIATMVLMFNNANVFNQNIGGWNVSNVTDMSFTFYEARAFNQNIGGWNVSNLANMTFTFNEARAFNQNISGWDVSNVTIMNNAFGNCYLFNSNIGGWNVSKVIQMNNLFRNANSFNQDISSWSVSNVAGVGMNNMFNGAAVFNQNLSSWVTGLTDQPVTFSSGANATFANNASNLKPYLQDGVTRINT